MIINLLYEVYIKLTHFFASSMKKRGKLKNTTSSKPQVSSFCSIYQIYRYLIYLISLISILIFFSLYAIFYRNSISLPLNDSKLDIIVENSYKTNDSSNQSNNIYPERTSTENYPIEKDDIQKTKNLSDIKYKFSNAIEEARYILKNHPIHSIQDEKSLEEVITYIHQSNNCLDKPVIMTMASVGSKIYWQMIENSLINERYNKALI